MPTDDITSMPSMYANYWQVRPMAWYLLWSVFPLLQHWKLTKPKLYDLSHTNSLVSFQWSGLFDQWTLRLTENCLQIQNWYPYKGRGVLLVPICADKVRNDPAKAAAMCTACHDYAHPHPPIPPFLLAQNLYLQNGLCQLITRGQSQTTPKSIIGA